MDSSSHKVALVTGAARRIGAAIARRLHADGVDLALHYRSSQAEMDALLAELNATRAGSVIALQADLAAFDRLPELIAQTVGRFGRLDALVNNASAFYPTAFGSVTPAQWDELFASNARAPFFLAQAATPHLQAAHGGIVNIADIHGETPLAGHSVYCMAKAALLMLTKSLAVDLAPTVRINAIAPGAILWPEHGKDEAAQAALLARVPLARMGTPEDIAAAVAWLLGDASGYVTGQTLHVDGGRGIG
ncbi:pteridine reductase [Thermomonas sp. HDW16]|uniref:pteridine reductase n=1 Tax=Thermomonas sp. HDW16 TaxID=2714945 RepID=UPI0014087F09|nr:pteridine reductase [Thermomonas sp. HDW16]QIL19673.1 pteridine reductase [Thermomonas sp. HDW16]